MKNENSALLVIDMQLVAFDGKITPPITGGTQVLSNASNLISTCRKAGLAIVYLQTCAEPGQPYAKDSHGWEIHTLIAPKDSDLVVSKVHSNGFEETSLHERLRALGIRTLYVCGIWSQYCVTATALAAIELGYKVCVAADCHGCASETEELAARIVSEQNAVLEQAGAIVQNSTELT